MISSWRYAAHLFVTNDLTFYDVSRLSVQGGEQLTINDYSGTRKIQGLKKWDDLTDFGPTKFIIHQTVHQRTTTFIGIASQSFMEIHLRVHFTYLPDFVDS